MKAETANIIRSILILDDSISADRIDRALATLANRQEQQEELTAVLRIQEVARMLKVSAATVNAYANAGLLERVYGAGTFTLGISKKSFIRFTEQRSPTLRTMYTPTTKTKSPSNQRDQLKRDLLKRKIAWALRGVASGTNRAKYEALIEYCKSHPGIPYAIGCNALSISRTGFAGYKERRSGMQFKLQTARRKILTAIQSLHPDKSKLVAILPLSRKLRRRRIRISPLSLKKIIDSEGYQRPKFRRSRIEKSSSQRWYHAEDFVECS